MSFEDPEDALKLYKELRIKYEEDLVKLNGYIYPIFILGIECIRSMILLHKPLGEIRHLYHETFDPVDRFFSSNKIGVVCDLI